MRALLYDIHANLPALEAVLADAEAAGAKSFVLGGDYALFGARPAETVARLHDLDAVWIRGNVDRWTANPGDAPDRDLVQRSIAFCREQLGEPLVRELAQLPERAEIEGVLFCHASPLSDLETFGTEPSEQDARLMQDVTSSAIVFGHSHVQFQRALGGRRLINPGSVGLPFDGDRQAAYAVWHDGGEVELRRVQYDTDAYVEDLRARMSDALGEGAETIARRLQQAAFVD